MTFDLNRLKERLLNHILCLNRLREESNRLNEILSFTEKSILLQCHAYLCGIFGVLFVTSLHIELLSQVRHLSGP